MPSHVLADVRQHSVGEIRADLKISGSHAIALSIIVFSAKPNPPVVLVGRLGGVQAASESQYLTYWASSTAKASTLYKIFLRPQRRHTKSAAFWSFPAKGTCHRKWTAWFFVRWDDQTTRAVPPHIVPQPTFLVNQRASPIASAEFYQNSYRRVIAQIKENVAVKPFALLPK